MTTNLDGYFYQEIHCPNSYCKSLGAQLLWTESSSENTWIHGMRCVTCQDEFELTYDSQAPTQWGDAIHWTECFQQVVDPDTLQFIVDYETYIISETLVLRNNERTRVLWLYSLNKLHNRIPMGFAVVHTGLMEPNVGEEHLEMFCLATDLDVLIGNFMRVIEFERIEK